MHLRTLPFGVEEILTQHHAPARLHAHLRLVHDVAFMLTEKLATELPELSFDREAVLIGAATHDIGKILHPNELSGPGREHEVDGRNFLISCGFPEKHARFALTHGGPTREPNPTIEDLLVMTADAIWKGGRYEKSEKILQDFICKETGKKSWETFMLLDDILTELAQDADLRISYQESFTLPGKSVN